MNYFYKFCEGCNDVFVSALLLFRSFYKNCEFLNIYFLNKIMNLLLAFPSSTWTSLPWTSSLLILKMFYGWILALYYWILKCAHQKFIFLSSYHQWKVYVLSIIYLLQNNKSHYSDVFELLVSPGKFSVLPVVTVRYYSCLKIISEHAPNSLVSRTTLVMGSIRRT